MLISRGTHNPKQARIAGILVSVVVLLSIWEFHGASPKAPPSPPDRTTKHRSLEHNDKLARRVEVTPEDLALRLEEIGPSESVDYAADGKDLFSQSLSPAAIEAPLTPVRPPPVSLAVADPPIEPPLPLDVKYLGYSQRGTGTLSATFQRGSDTYIANTGDIMFHRFRVGQINASGVQVTDLRDNHMQLVPAASE